MGTNMNLNEQRSWIDLPMEILSFIAIRLPILELLGFRGTCKEFRLASTTSTAKIESSRKPWLLFHKPDDSKWVIYNKDASKTYKWHIPDLDGATCLASYQGWLLLNRQESMYFFCPFSFAKIPLPDFPLKQLEGHVASFSEPPTSPNCIVSIINQMENSFFQINMISKGQKTWTQHNITPRSVGAVSGATFDHKSQMFYYMYGENKLLTFSVNDKKGTQYNIVVTRGETNKDIEPLPYSYSDKMFERFKKDLELNVEDDEYVNVCGLTYEREDYYPMVYLNEAIDVSPTKTRKCTAVWVQPRFYESHKDMHW